MQTERSTITAMANADPQEKPIVLIVDDEYKVFQALPRLISPKWFKTILANGERQGLEILRERRHGIGIVIVDLKSTGMGGGGFLHRARRLAPKVPVFVTGPLAPFLFLDGQFYEACCTNLKTDITAMLLEILRKGSMEGLTEGGARSAKAHRSRFGIMIGQSRGMNAIYNQIEDLKDSSASVLIQGESGTGKELVARTIHKMSARKRGPFVAINCGAIPVNLVESELFGHERGAFTSAVSKKKGKFEIADRGTLFLDEIGELPKDLQVTFLRVLQEREFQRVGGNVTFKIDIRLIAATIHDLRSAVVAGHFREDLFYRMNVIPIRLPPLRERSEDIPLLLHHFFQELCASMGRPIPAMTGKCLEALTTYRYPGNIRELRNIAERLLVACHRDEISVQDLPEEILEGAGYRGSAQPFLKDLPLEGVPLKELEKELILKTLKHASGNKAATARMLGMTRRLLYLRLSQYGFLPCKDVT